MPSGSIFVTIRILLSDHLSPPGSPVTSSSIVLLSGMLRGMGREAQCEILARRLNTASHNSPHSTDRYLECSVLTAPRDLPDGDYLAYFDGHSLVATLARGVWSSRGPAVRDPGADHLDEGREVNVEPERREKPRDSEGGLDCRHPSPLPVQRVNRFC